jgi:DNA-binding LytR/AlgR family response regulator
MSSKFILRRFAESQRDKTLVKGGGILKIEILIDEGATDLEISVTCRQLTPRVEKILATLRMMNQQLTARKDDEIHLLDIARVIYIESVDRKCFIYTDGDVYESDFPLYELERQLAEYGFFRVSKSFLIHLQNIQSLKADVNRKIRVTMSNGEQIMASRQYAEALKKRLGVR